MFFRLLILTLTYTSLRPLLPSGTMTVSCTTVFTLMTIIFSASDALFGVQNDTFFVSEDAGPAVLCVVLLDGCLERDVVIDYSTLDATAESMTFTLSVCVSLLSFGYFQISSTMRGDYHMLSF